RDADFCGSFPALLLAIESTVLPRTDNSAEQRGKRGNLAEGSGLDHERHDHGPTSQTLIDPAPDRASHDLRERVCVADALLGRLRKRCRDLGPDVVEDRVVLRDAPRVDLGT